MINKFFTFRANSFESFTNKPMNQNLYCFSILPKRDSFIAIIRCILFF